MTDKEVLPLDELVRQLRRVNARQLIQVDMQGKSAQAARRREHAALDRIKELETRLRVYEPDDI